MKTEQKFKQKLVFGSLIAILVISSFMYQPVIADGGEDDGNDKDNDGIDDHVEDDNERQVQVDYSENEVQIESSIERDGMENQFQIKVKTESDGLKFKLEFSAENGSVESELEFEVRFSQIVEFRDVDADGIFTNADQVVQTLLLNDFKDILYTVENINNVTVHKLFVETTDNVFSAALYVSGEFANISGVIVTPTEVKVDVGIHNFNYTELDTQLALKVKLESEKSVDYENSDNTQDEEYGYVDDHNDEQQVEVSLNDYSGFFSWIETAIVDGVEVPVKVTPLEMNSEENSMYLNYPRGTEIIHDPKIGVANLLAIGNTSFLGINNLALIAATSILTLAGLVLVFRKRFKR